MKKGIAVWGFLFTFLCVSLWGDLCEVDSVLKGSLSSTAIVNTKQINIPGYPNAYNPSLIPYKEGYLLSFRYISRCPKEVKNSFHSDVSFVGVVRLDKKFSVFEKTIQLLNIVSYSDKFSLSAEDARLLSVGERIFVFFNDLPLFGRGGKFAMYFGELIEEGGMFHLKGPAKLLSYNCAMHVEKNWSPFVSGDNLRPLHNSPK